MSKPYPFASLACLAASSALLVTGNAKSQPNGDGSILVSGELKAWHKVSLTMSGPFAKERDVSPNPFTDYRLTVRFSHASGRQYDVPGFFAADGNAAESSATAGNCWRAYFAPDLPGRWDYQIEFLRGQHIIFPGDKPGPSTPVALLHGKKGSFTIQASDKQLPDFRARGRLAYVGESYLQFQGDQSYFVKAGADAPETLLAYEDFDGTESLKKKTPLKSWSPHVRDWSDGDPTWKNGKGKGLIGALNYLSGKGCNAFSFLPYNVDGDGSNVWPFVAPREKLHYDCSKLDQWGVVFDHATSRGLYLHFKLQETEIDDNRHGRRKKVPASLDGGKMGLERALYCRELIARFGHNLALNWNLGEENTQSTEEQLAMARFIRATDPYDHHLVVHTYPNQQDAVYGPLLGKSAITGASLQNSNIRDCHRHTLKWVERSRKTKHPWVVAFDEPGDASYGMPPDPTWPGMGTDSPGPDIHEVRKFALWGTLMAGGCGVEYYFGYKHPENDLLAEDWRSRDQSWDYARHALSFFRDAQLPMKTMRSRNELIGNDKDDNQKYCLAGADGPFVIYLPDGGETAVKLPKRKWSIQWFNPRNGTFQASKPLGSRRISAPDNNDWVALIR